LHRQFQEAVALHQRGDLEQARAAYEKVLESTPRHADALHLLGVIAAQTNDLRTAVDLIERAIVIDSHNPAAYCNLGGALHRLRQWDAALTNYDKAIALKTDYADAHFNRGNVLKDLGQLDAALVSYRRAIAARPDFAAAHLSRADLLYQLKRMDEALASYAAALAIRPDFAEAHCNRSNALHELKRLDEALAGYDRAIAIRPEFAAAYSNRGNVLRELDQYDAAIASYDQAIAIDAAFAPAHFNRGVALNQLGRPGEALASYDRAIAIDADFAEAHFNRSLVRLLTADFAGGWIEHEWRWRNKFGSNINERRSFPQPLWLGEKSLAGKTILLYSEQGFGDTLQFCRYARPVSQLGAKVILEVPKPLESLLGDLQGISQLITRGEAPPDFDYQCPLMSLPLALNTTLESIPAAGKYLNGDPAKVARWESRLGERTGKRIGLMWNGNPIQPNNRNRSLWLADWVPHLPAGFQYVSLQKELRERDARTLAGNPQILNVAADLQDFSDTAALCECMDLVISVCTSVAHLSAALGKRTWILLAYAADWRWLLDRSDSPWYPTAKLYRQRTRGEWSSVFEQVAADLSRGA